MMKLWLAIVLIAAALVIGVIVGFIIRKAGAERKIGSAEEQARKILEDAIKNAESAKKESIISAKEEIFNLKKEADFDVKERRKEVSKQVAKCGEEAKVAIRNIRRDANDFLKNEKKAGNLTEDEAKSGEKDAQDLTDKYIKSIDALVAAKTKEVMEI